jgi:hypothetical protein
MSSDPGCASTYVKRYADLPETKQRSGYIKSCVVTLRVNAHYRCELTLVADTDGSY